MRSDHFFPSPLPDFAYASSRGADAVGHGKSLTQNRFPSYDINMKEAITPTEYRAFQKAL
jgi:hypothetical protein